MCYGVQVVMPISLAVAHDTQGNFRHAVGDKQGIESFLFVHIMAKLCVVLLFIIFSLVCHGRVLAFFQKGAESFLPSALTRMLAIARFGNNCGHRRFGSTML